MEEEQWKERGRGQTVVQIRKVDHTVADANVDLSGKERNNEAQM